LKPPLLKQHTDNSYREKAASMLTLRLIE